MLHIIHIGNKKYRKKAKERLIEYVKGVKDLSRYKVHLKDKSLIKNPLSLFIEFEPD